MGTFTGHDGCVYEAQWSPLEPHVFASCSGDRTLKTYDIRLARHQPTCSIVAHGAEVLCLDWCKYTPNIVTGSVDTLMHVWDTRNLSRGPVSTLSGHEFAVRRVKASPHHPQIVASCSYDMSCRLWDIQKSIGVQVYDNLHSEFVYGLDFSLFAPRLATCGWDAQVCVLELPTPTA